MHATHVVARALIRDGGHGLVVRADGQSHTFLPCRHREPGEGLEACLRRESHEELGVEPIVREYLGVVEHQGIRDRTTNYEVNHCVSVSVSAPNASERSPAREGHLTFGWVQRDHLEAIALEPAPLRNLLAGSTPTPWWVFTLGVGERAGGSGWRRSIATEGGRTK